MPADEILQTVTLKDGTEVEIRALTPVEAARVKPNFFTWDEATARKVAAIAIVKPSGILERDLSREERDKIFRATGSAWLQGWMETKRSAPVRGGPTPYPDSRKTRWISPNFSAEKLQGADDTLENRIAVYEDRLRGWFLRWAEHLNDAVVDDRRHPGFAVLQLGFAYFEAHAVFLCCRGAPPRKPAGLFRAGVLDVFPELERNEHRDSILEILWKDGRNGLFLSGVASTRMRLEDDPKEKEAFRYQPAERVLSVCRQSLVRRIGGHLERYLARLRDPGEVKLRTSFQKAWEAVHRR